MAEKTARKRRWIWLRVALSPPLALGVGLFGLGVALWSWGDGPGAPRQVPCTEAVSFARATLPESARDQDCTVRVWMDTLYDASFRMPRSESEAWLAATYPGAEPRTYCDQDLCLDIQYGDAAKPDGPAAVEVEVVYEDGDTALVRLVSFTV